MGVTPGETRGVWGKLPGAWQRCGGNCPGGSSREEAGLGYWLGVGLGAHWGSQGSG